MFEKELAGGVEDFLAKKHFFSCSPFCTSHIVMLVYGVKFVKGDWGGFFGECALPLLDSRGSETDSRGSETDSRGSETDSRSSESLDDRARAASSAALEKKSGRRPMMAA